ncbi:MAG: hypothetical protein A2498_01645 [Lentisphaerae bacterium RIFOXYC12_FULL_60_16]|nr:MAG: hypothetical protein A2498_01645 [Lentisphaerae bacterium RIFOXYC12_FULL_60_16]OGV85143.1 MAG: hypothetical protein A2340_01090 [Lentisphaerae bacterium RIFOXYB12_FULL_60_10]
MGKRRAILVGNGGRSFMYRDAAAFKYPDHVELVGLVDINPGRARLSQSALEQKGLKVPVAGPDALETFIRKQKADLVIVTSRDSTHDEFIVRAMDAGCDVITEKPMTINAAKCQRILDAVKRTGRQVRVTFNYRYSPPREQVKELLQEGAIGKVLSVEFKWLLDTSHGADYFRRWHRNKENSGGLMVHKATHHFDLVNWWINSVPKRVTALGSRVFYTPEQAERYGLTNRGERCHACAESNRCPFFLDLDGYPQLKSLYLDQESHDGYFRDRCIFSDSIDIEDTMNVAVEYRNGVRLSYALNAFSPWEGYHVAFNGTKGRLEQICRETSYINGDGSVPGQTVGPGTTLALMPHFTSGTFLPVRTGEGGHGGGDERLLDDLFIHPPKPDPLCMRADYRGGAWSILTGIAANIAMAEKRVVEVDELVKGLEMPDYPATPAWDAPIPVPEFLVGWDVSDVLPRPGPVAQAPLPASTVTFKPLNIRGSFQNAHDHIGTRDGLVYFRLAVNSATDRNAELGFGADGPARVWVNETEVGVWPDLTNPCVADKCRAPVTLRKGRNMFTVALDSNGGKAWGISVRLI